MQFYMNFFSFFFSFLEWHHFSSFFVFIAGSPTIIFDVLALGTTDFYVLFVPGVSGIMLGAAASDRLLNYFPAIKIMHYALIAMFALAIINFALNYFAEISILRVVLPLALYAFCLSIIMPIVSVEILNCFPNNRGAASAMQSFIQMGINGFIISLIVGALGTLFLNFTLAQISLMTFAIVLWMIDIRSSKNV